jgi:dipeptidyl-peptidase-3
MSSGRYWADQKAPFCKLEAKPFFESLDHRQKTYAHHMSRAAFQGTRIIMAQTNPQAESIYELILKVFSTPNGQLTNVSALEQRR